MSNTHFSKDLSLSSLDLRNFEGCPATIGGDFFGSDNSNLVNLVGTPALASRFFIHNCENLKSLEGLKVASSKKNSMPLHLSFDFAGCNNLSDISVFKDFRLGLSLSLYLKKTSVSLETIVTTLYNIRQEAGSWSFLSSDHEPKTIERTYLLFEKLDFNQEKLSKAIDLVF